MGQLLQQVYESRDGRNNNLRDYGFTPDYLYN